MKPPREELPPLYVELGFEEVAPHVFSHRDRPAGRVVSAERLWGALRTNLARLKERTPK